MACFFFRGVKHLHIFGPLHTLQILSRQYQNRSQTPLTYPSPSIDPSSQPEHEPEEVRLLPERRPNPHVERRQNVDVFTVFDGLETRALDSNNTMYCIDATYPKVQHLVITCNGAWLAAQAGVLDGKVATTNKSC